MKQSPHIMAKAAAITTGIVYLVCWLLLWIAPVFSMGVARTWFHSLDISKIYVPVATDPGTIFIGLVTIVIGTWAVVYMYGMIYNFLVKKWK